MFMQGALISPPYLKKANAPLTGWEDAAASFSEPAS
jgi:hypothetical protein